MAYPDLLRAAMLAQSVALCAACTGSTSTFDGETSGGSESSSSSESTSSGGTETGDGSSSGGGTGPISMPCDPPPQFDGSEVIELVEVSRSTEWNGASSTDYVTFVDETNVYEGRATRAIRSVAEPSRYEFAAVNQSASAEPYRGRRVRMRAYGALVDVQWHAGTWLRVDGPDGSLLLDNSEDHPRYGTSSDWEPFDIVLDVPEEAQTLVFGILLVGQGAIWIGDATFEVVTDDVPTTEPNRLPPPQAEECPEPGDEVIELLHYTRAHQWNPQLGQEPTNYELTRDEAMPFNGVSSLHIQSRPDTIPTSMFLQGFFGWLTYSSPNRRVRLSAPVHTQGFDGELSMWIRVDTPGQALSFIQPIPAPQDLSDWERQAVVFDVPAGIEGRSVNGGIFVEGTGDVWVGYGVIEEVAADVPVSPRN